MKRHYDRYVDEAPAFVPGDRVFLEHKEIVTSRPSQKLDFKRHGPFVIAEKLSDTAYRLELPATMRLVHPVFHVSHLVPYRKNTVLGRVPQPPPPVEVDGEEEYEVEGIRDMRRRGRADPPVYEYLVHWEGYPDSEDTWEPADAFDKAQEIFAAWWERVNNGYVPRGMKNAGKGRKRKARRGR